MKNRIFKHGKLYRLKEDYKGYFGFIPKGTILKFNCPNLGFAMFNLLPDNFERLQKTYKGTSVHIKPKIAFKIFEELEENSKKEHP